METVHVLIEIKGLSPLFLVALNGQVNGVDRESLVTLKFRAKVLIAGRKSKGWNGD